MDGRSTPVRVKISHHCGLLHILITVFRCYWAKSDTIIKIVFNYSLPYMEKRRALSQKVSNRKTRKCPFSSELMGRTGWNFIPVFVHPHVRATYLPSFIKFGWNLAVIQILEGMVLAAPPCSFISFHWHGHDWCVPCGLTHCLQLVAIYICPLINT